MMDWFVKIRNWYLDGVWTIEMVQNAVKMGKITQEQCDEILARKTA